MKKKLINSLFLALIVSSGNVWGQAGYPVPPANKNMLFYLQRTHNTNTVIYEINYKNGKIDDDEPVKVYWIRYADGGGTEQLSSIQRVFAYGVSSSIYNKEQKWFKITLKAYDKASIYLKNNSDDKKYHAYIHINGVLCELTKIFVKTDGGSTWSPNVVYVEITGKDPKTKKTVSEKIKP
ncbi:DUF4833 domain-containing protein [Fluviicola taffensis]|uniref:DUF4833 domain-containing protein n=1 Tax=Fluviicola taffensis TaxID=191579 RepID=UPI0031384974